MLETLRTLGEATDIHDLLDKVYVVDQGTDRVRDRADFADAAKKLGDHVQVVEQGNLGGSGGFARAMDETVRAGRADYVLLMDDDVEIDPEGILRAVTFADLARQPTIVGGHMFSLRDRSLLHAFAEGIEPYKWWWGAAPEHQGQARLRPAEPAQHPVAAPPCRLRLQRLVDVPDPGAGHQRDRPRAAGLHQVGRRRVRRAGPRARLSDGVAARRGRVAGAVGRQGRRAGLAGLLPHAQPSRRRAAALARTTTAGPSSPKAWSGSCRACSPCSTPRPRCGARRSRTC